MTHTTTEETEEPITVTRGGLTLTTAREIADEEIVCVFVIDGEYTRTVWVDQQLPALGDHIVATAVGGEGDSSVLEVKDRLWMTATLVVVSLVDAGTLPGEDAP